MSEIFDKRSESLITHRVLKEWVARNETQDLVLHDVQSDVAALKMFDGILHNDHCGLKWELLIRMTTIDEVVIATGRHGV